MGFPVGYSELFLPNLLLHFFSLLSVLRKVICGVFRLLGLGDFIESDVYVADQSFAVSEIRSVSAILMRDILPVVRFEELVATTECNSEMPDSCAVCLYEFEGQEEIRRLKNCRHIFHRHCLDRWMDHDQSTCPLCRTPLIPTELQEVFN